MSTTIGETARYKVAKQWFAEALRKLWSAVPHSRAACSGLVFADEEYHTRVGECLLLPSDESLYATQTYVKSKKCTGVALGGSGWCDVCMDDLLDSRQVINALLSPLLTPDAPPNKYTNFKLMSPSMLAHMTRQLRDENRTIEKRLTRRNAALQGQVMTKGAHGAFVSVWNSCKQFPSLIGELVQCCGGGDRGDLDRCNRLKFFTDMIHNMNAENHGQRYGTHSKHFYLVALMMFGKRVASYFAENFGGPDTSTIKRWQRDLVAAFDRGITLKNIERAICIYESMLEERGGGRLQLTVAMDEACHYSTVEYSDAEGVLYGFCGRQATETDPHRCECGFAPPGRTYGEIEDAFLTCQRAKHTCAIVLTPLHDGFPPLVIALVSTCLSQDVEQLQEQVADIERFWREARGNERVGILTGIGSDGCSVRRKFMANRLCGWLALELEMDGLDDATFVCRFTMDDGVCTNDAQDWRHVLKRLVNQMRQTARVLQIDVHMFTLETLIQLIGKPLSSLKLRLDDVNRSDRQSVPSAQRMAMHNVVAAVRELNTSGGYLDGLVWYLELVGDFLDIFCSNHHTAGERVLKCSRVYHSLLMWRQWCLDTNSVTVEHPFLTHQTFVDTTICVHHAVNALRMCRDNKTLPLQLERTGEDACENVFRHFGMQHVAQRSFTALSANRQVANDNAVAYILNNTGVRNERSARTKRDVIWNQNYPEKGSKKPATIECHAVPDDNELLKIWQQGRQEARQHIEGTLAVRVATDAILIASANACFSKLQYDNNMDQRVELPSEFDIGPETSDDIDDESLLDEVMAVELANMAMQSAHSEGHLHIEDDGAMVPK